MRATVETMESPFDAQVEARKLTYDDIVAALAEVGISCSRVQLDGMRLSTAGIGPGHDAVLVVTMFAENAEGKKYVDPDTREVATETKRFYLYGDLHLSVD